MTDAMGRHPATEATVRAQREFAASLPADDPEDFERVNRGFIATRETTEIASEAAARDWAPIAWDLSNWDFVEGDAPDSVNPSLWRQAKLNGVHGLFEVVPGYYQIRSFDTSVVTFIRGDAGWVVIDPLTTTETARAAYEIVSEHLEALPVTAVIYTHTHVDHYGGILGLTSRDRIEAGKVTIVAPEGFLDAAVAENVVAGAAMGRRATYQYGMLLPWDARGHVDQGLSKGPPVGTVSMVPPTIEITETGQELVLDGVRVEFQLTPDTEAPAEMHFYFPDQRVLCLAENCTGTLHNVGTLRGAVVRDALLWSRYIDEAIDRWGDDLEVSIASHSWPRWGREDVVGHMTRQRDMYRWIHDEAMRLANLGYFPDEIAATVELPPELWKDWSCHGYYGTVSHNVRAVYQRYLGWYDGHPSSLSPYPPVDTGQRYVEFMGGMDQLVANAQRSFDEGDYRWVAQVLRHAVFADPSHRPARELQAAAFEQLGYQAEAGPWRDIYLMGAQELRAGSFDLDFAIRPDVEAASGMTMEQVFDYLAIRLDGPAALELGDFTVNWVDPAAGGPVLLTLSNGTLHSRPGQSADDALATVTCDRQTINELVGTGETLRSRVDAGTVTISGDSETVLTMWDLMVDFPMFYDMIEPGSHSAPSS